MGIETMVILVVLAFSLIAINSALLYVKLKMSDEKED